MLFPAMLFVVAAVRASAPGAAQDPSFQQVIGQTTALRPTESSLIGTIDRFDNAERRLTLKTKDGAKVTFVVPTDATIRMGPRTLPAQELNANSGRRAKVRFTVANGHRTAHWVAISSEAPRSS